MTTDGAKLIFKNGNPKRYEIDKNLESIIPNAIKRAL